MQRRSLILATVAAAVAAAPVALAPVRPASAALAITRRVRADTSPVVLELFTSQGCSSCPPADALLGDLARRPDVIALAWHVDYWNGLGWRDPYATRLATDRQRTYAADLRDDVYTPALVVNGAAMVVGSDRGAIADAIARTPAAALPVSLRRDASGLTAEAGVTAEPLTALLVAYDPMRVTAVGAGENGGRRLTEYHIVRQADSLGAWQSGGRPISLPAVQPGRGIVLILQSSDLRVRGAAHLPATAQPDNAL